MAGLRRDREHLGWLAGLALQLFLSQGCARHEPPQPVQATSPGHSEHLPFHSDEETILARDGKSSGDIPASTSAPFQTAHPRLVPSGTLLMVRLENSLSCAKVHVGDAFTASVAAPITVDGATLVERGAAVTGRVEAARSHMGQSHGGLRSGYIQLGLTGMTLAGREVELQTSSLFAQGTFQPPDGVRVAKGRHLTFRLTAPLALANSPASP